MKFAHLADIHLGAWRDEKIRQLNYKAFEQAVNKIINLEVDFVIVAGDFFNNSFPSMDAIKTSVKGLKKLKDRNIDVYCVPGSHDFSPTGKTMLDVLEEAGLITNVARAENKEGKIKLKFFLDEKNNLAITGMVGRRLTLERTYFENLDRDYLENRYNDYNKIFVFHSAITETKPENYEHTEAIPLSYLPKNFDYYASGHIHKRMKNSFPGYKLIAFPGALFPNSFKEIQENKEQLWGFYLFNNEKLDFIPINVINFYNIIIESKNKSSKELEQEIIANIEDKEFYDTIITIKLSGILKDGRISDIDVKRIIEICYDKGAYAVLRNFSALKSKEIELIKVNEKLDLEEIKTKIINETISDALVFDKEKTKQFITSLFEVLGKEKQDGEKQYDYETRIKKHFETMIEKYKEQNYLDEES